MKLLFLLILLSVSLFPQEPDSIFADTTGILSEKSVKIKDTLITLNQDPFFESSKFITSHQIKHTNYRYAGDLLNLLPFVFIKDLGLIGQPADVFIYGSSDGYISFFQDGILYNNRLTNSLDLIQIQANYVDSIEIIPLPRGFLYGIYNKNVSVNFITKDFFASAPYSRIKYIQGENGEAMVDGMFNSLIAKDFKVSFDITNKKYDSAYTNSEFNLWQAKVRLKYFASEKLNLMGTYDYVHLRRGLNGGVDVDSISKITLDINSILYDENFAPVIFPGRNEEVNQHNYILKTLAKPFENAETELSFYFRFSQDKISGIDSTSLENKIKNKIFGIYLNQKYSTGMISLNLLTNYERPDLSFIVKSEKVYSEINYLFNNFSAAAVFSLDLLEGKLSPSFFYKYSSISRKYPLYFSNSYNGAGVDVTINLFEDLKFYIGYSSFQFAPEEDAADNFEVSLEYLIPKILFLNIKAFSQVNLGASLLIINPADKVLRKANGVSGNISLNLWKANIEAKAVHLYSVENYPARELIIPDIIFDGGIYYKDILFGSSLNLKTGFILNYFGKQKFNSIYFEQTKPSLTVGFTLIGEIKEAAIVYFTWENLFDVEYFMTPFYPMRSRNIRFGLSWELFN